MIWNLRTDYTSTHTLRHIRPLSVHAHTLCELKKSWPVNFQFVPFVAYIPYACALSLPIYTTIPMRNERREREGDWVSERSVHFYCHLMNSNSWNDCLLSYKLSDSKNVRELHHSDHREFSNSKQKATHLFVVSHMGYIKRQSNVPPSSPPLPALHVTRCINRAIYSHGFSCSCQLML